MRVSIILGHPYPESYNAAIAKEAADAVIQNGHAALFHDLYAERFDPVMPAGELASDITEDPLVRQHQQELQQADGLIMIKFYGLPACPVRWRRVTRPCVYRQKQTGPTYAARPLIKPSSDLFGFCTAPGTKHLIVS